MAELFGERWEIVKSINKGGQAYIDKVRDMRKQDHSHYVF